MSSMDLHWHKSFFQGGALDIWRAALSAENTSAEVDFLIAELDVKPEERLLDAPCGNGRHMIEFARRGFRVVGADLSGGMLAEARRNADGLGEKVRIIEGDIRELAWPGSFRGAYCFGNSFSYLDREGARAFLRSVAGALVQGGRFVLDTAMCAESVLPSFREHVWWEAGDIHVLENNTWLAELSVIEQEQKYFRRGSEEVEIRTCRHSIYTVGELRAMIELAGMKVVECYCSINREPFALASSYLILTAEKN